MPRDARRIVVARSFDVPLCSGYAIFLHLRRSGEVMACASLYRCKKRRCLERFCTSPNIEGDITMKSYRSAVVSATLPHVDAAARVPATNTIADHPPETGPAIAAAERRRRGNRFAATGTPPMIPGRKVVSAVIAGLVVLAASARAAPPPASPGPSVIADDVAFHVMRSGAGARPDPLRPVLSQARCVLANDFVWDGGAISVGGFAGRDAEAVLHRQLTGIVRADLLDWHVQPVDSVFCDALGVLHPVSAWAGAPFSGLTVTAADNITTLHDGQRIKLRVTMSDFAGKLRVDYLAHDGSVMHLYPASADPSQNAAADPTVTLPPGAVLSLGERSPGHPGWEVAPPYGTDMIIAVASTAPLLAQSPTRNAEDNAALYLRSLANGIAEVRRSGGQIAGTLLLINTVEK
jgi:hypothetical protein